MKAVVCAAVVASAAFAAWADTATLIPVKDNTLFEDTAGGTSNGAGPNVFVGNNAQGSSRRALLAFDLSSIPAGSTITGVSLTMFMAQGQTPTQTVTMHRVLADWGEGSSNSGPSGGNGAMATTGDATWLHRFYDSVTWASAGGDFAAGVSASTLVGDVGSYTWTGPGLVADVQAWVDGTLPNYGWLMLGDEATASTAKRFISREGSIESQRPTLVVEYVVPAPATLALAGLSLLAGARRRR
jgi:hypothetical protein